MPFTLSDLRKWEKQKDIGKFQQILKFLDTDDYAPARSLAVKALGRIHDTRTIEPLLTTASDPIQEVRTASLRVLNRWIKQDLELFCQAVESKTLGRQSCKTLIVMLVNLRSDRVTGSLLRLLQKERYINVIQKSVAESGAVEPFLPYAQSSDPSVRYAAILALIKVARNRQVHQVYTAALTDNDVQVRVLAQSSLADEIYDITTGRKTNVRLKDYPGVMDALTANLSHEDFMVRDMAAYALGTFRVRSTIGLLIPLLNDPFIMVRRSTVFALSRMPDQRAFIPLTELYRSEEDPSFRKRIVDAIAPIKHSGVFPFLKEIIESKKSRMARIHAIIGISRFDTPETLEILEKVIHEEDMEFVDYALESMKQLSDPRRIEIMHEVIHDETKNVFFSTMVHFAETLDKENALQILTCWLGRQKEDQYLQRTIDVISRIIAPQTFEDALAAMPDTGSALYLNGLAKLKTYPGQKES